MKFIRNADPKVSLGIGLGKEIENMMSKQSMYNFDNYYDVWAWALENEKNDVFSYIVNMNGKIWINGDKIDVSDFNNELLKQSIIFHNIVAVKCLLSIPNLFSKEVFTLEQGTSKLKNQFVYRGHTKISMRATNFGVFINLVVEHYPNKEIERLLLKYYKNV